MSIPGIVASSGLAFGQALHLHQQDSPLDYRLLPLADVPAQQQKLSRALKELTGLLRSGQRQIDSRGENYQLIEADLLLLEDETLIAQIHDSIARLQFSASVAVERAFAHQASELEAMDSPYLASRAQDVRCLGKRLLAAIEGTLKWDLGTLDKPSILLCHDLTPAEFAMLPLKYISGLVLATGGLTCHTAILARAAGIPALLSCPYQQAKIVQGQPLVLDAIEGTLHVAPTPELYLQMQEKQQAEQARKARLQSFKDRETATLDGHKTVLLANVAGLNEITHLEQVGAEGVGLFRTEFMLMNVSSIPDEKAQFSLYCDALHALKGLPFTIRTLDIGADKEAPCLYLPPEDNPALGMRGVRYTLAHPQLLTTQLRAVLRAAHHGPIRLMFPMVNQVEELDRVFALIDDCKAQLKLEDKAFGELSYGIVVETPAAVLNLDSMLPRLDFVSIGTNDLTQYTMAADRSNPLLTRDYPSLSPAILTLIKMTIDKARPFGATVSLCGELASDPRTVPLLVGLGLDELSINLSSLLEVKSCICSGNYRQFVHRANEALAFQRIAELEDYLASDS